MTQCKWMVRSRSVETIDRPSVGCRTKGGRTFVIEAIYPVDTGTFVVAAQDEEVFGIFDLVGKEKTDGFK